MATLRLRIISGISSVVLLVLSIYLLAKFSFNAYTYSPFYLNILFEIIFAFNIVILLAWTSFGISSGLAAILISSGAVLLYLLRMRRPEYSVYLLPFLASGIIGYLYTRRCYKVEQSCALKLESLGEDINMLLADTKKRSASIESVEEKLVRYSFLKEIAESFSAVLSLEDIDKLIIDKTLKILGKPGRALLFLVDTHKQELMLAASYNAPSVLGKKGDAFDRWVLRNRKTLIIEDIGKDFRFSAAEVDEARIFFKSLIAAPLVIENKVIGILRVDCPEEFMYAQDDLRLLDIIANLGAVAAQNAMLYSRTQELAIKDSLTGLAVRRYFLERFAEEIKRAERKIQPLSLLLLDIDHFKEYNDQYGHAAGDIVLKHIAHILRSFTHEGDIAGRYGGEEMVVLLYGKGKREAALEAEKIRKAVSEKTLLLRRREIGVTVSIGVSTFSEDGIREEELVRVADERLYKAKAAGRNKVLWE